MSIQNKLTFSVSSSGGGISLNGSVSETGATEINVDQNYAAASTNILTTCAWTVANTQSLFLYSDKGCVIKTNSSGSPANTITLAPGIPLVWDTSAGYFSNPFTTNVTSWYVTSTYASRLQAKILTS